MTEDASQVPQAPRQPRRSPLRRLGCIIALVIWFAVLLSPCFLIVLATQQEIVVSTGSAPGQQTRLWLISEIDARGLALSSASVREQDESAICVQTDVRFFLWAGTAAPVSYCECYERDSAGNFSFTTGNEGVCTE